MTFHAKLAAAQKNVREPLGRTRALHHGAEGDAAVRCWQPARREEPASDGGTLETKGAGGSALGEGSQIKLFLASSISTARAGNGSIYLQKGRRA